MPNHALIVLHGHIGKDPEHKFLPDGTAVLKFSLAVNTGFGEKKLCSWYAVSMFGKRADSVSKFLAKGTPICVIGEPSVRNWQTPDGSKKGTSVEVRANDIVLLGSKHDAQPQDRDGQREVEEGNPYHGNDQVEKDVPF